MKYVIHSKSERGFWNHKQGWVYGIAQASKFVNPSLINPKFNLPSTKEGDAEWIVYKYDE